MGDFMLGVYGFVLGSFVGYGVINLLMQLPSFQNLSRIAVFVALLVASAIVNGLIAPMLGIQFPHIVPVGVSLGWTCGFLAFFLSIQHESN